jgi:Protein of unknown function (DUF2510)
MTTQPPPAGWYPDPSGKPGQMYWDGQAWQAPPTPPGYAHFPSPPGRRARFVKVGLVAAVGAVLLVGAINLFGGDHPSQPAPAGHPASSGQAAPSGRQAAPHPGKHNPASRSPAYQEGYDEGYQHMNAPLMGELDCRSAAGQYDVARRDQPDYIQGCVDGLADMYAEPGAPTFSMPELPQFCADEKQC